MILCSFKGSGWLVDYDPLLTPSAKSLDCVGRFSHACKKYGAVIMETERIHLYVGNYNHVNMFTWNLSIVCGIIGWTI